jgi:aryl-alcohol dehydrogenase-like predicted oxidoreductase
MSDAATLGEAFTAFAEVAQTHGVTPQQVCLAWELARSEAVVPIPGASRPESVADSVRAVDLALTPEELTRLDG